MAVPAAAPRPTAPASPRQPARTRACAPAAAVRCQERHLRLQPQHHRLKVRHRCLHHTARHLRGTQAHMPLAACAAHVHAPFACVSTSSCWRAARWPRAPPRAARPPSPPPRAPPQQMARRGWPRPAVRRWWLSAGGSRARAPRAGARGWGARRPRGSPGAGRCRWHAPACAGGVVVEARAFCGAALDGARDGCCGRACATATATLSTRATPPHHTCAMASASMRRMACSTRICGREQQDWGEGWV